MSDFDLAIVGGGINGTGIARDAAGRGLRVLLVEQNDLASGTSSASTKLIHGGLRYLEHGWFRLVREALAEREVMLRMAPHLIRPMRFVLPVGAGHASILAAAPGAVRLRSSRRAHESCLATRTVDLARRSARRAAAAAPRQGFEYSDCFADDARLVVLNALDAAERGAVIRTRTRCIRAERSTAWRLVLEVRGRRDLATARVLVNATGPWLKHVRRRRAPRYRAVARTARQGQPHRGAAAVRARPRLYRPDRPTGGSSSRFHSSGISRSSEPPTRALPAIRPGSSRRADEIGYLCDVTNQHFRASIGPADVVWSFAGVRSLYDDGAGKAQDVSRDYVLTLDELDRAAPLLTVYGGKITTYRRLAEHALDRLAHVLDGGRRGPRTRACRAANSPMTASRRSWPRRASPGRF